MSFLTCHFVFQRIITLSNDVEENPGPTNNNIPNSGNNNNIPISICHSNVRSIVADLGSNYKRLNQKPPKVIETESFCDTNSINIMAITESWCKESHSNDLISVEGLQKKFRRDRADRVGGDPGVCLR